MDNDLAQVLVAIGRLETQMTELSKTVSDSVARLGTESERNRTNIHALRDEFHKHLLNEIDKPCKEHATLIPWVKCKIEAHDRALWVGGGIIIAVEVLLRFFWR